MQQQQLYHSTTHPGMHPGSSWQFYLHHTSGAPYMHQMGAAGYSMPAQTMQQIHHVAQPLLPQQQAVKVMDPRQPMQTSEQMMSQQQQQQSYENPFQLHQGGAAVSAKQGELASVDLSAGRKQARKVPHGKYPPQATAAPQLLPIPPGAAATGPQHVMMRSQSMPHAVTVAHQPAQTRMPDRSMSAQALQASTALRVEAAVEPDERMSPGPGEVTTGSSARAQLLIKRVSVSDGDANDLYKRRKTDDDGVESESKEVRPTPSPSSDPVTSAAATPEAGVQRHPPASPIKGGDFEHAAPDSTADRALTTDSPKLKQVYEGGGSVAPSGGVCTTVVAFSDTFVADAAAPSVRAPTPVQQQQPQQQPPPSGAIVTTCEAAHQPGPAPCAPTSRPQHPRHGTLEDGTAAVGDLGPEQAGGAGADRLLCVICQDADRQVLFSPCRHICLCAECCKNIDKCPICRSQIEARCSIFLS